MLFNAERSIIGTASDALAQERVKVSFGLGADMQKYKIADLIVGVDFQYERGYKQAQPYRIDDDAEPDDCLKPNDFQIKYALDHGCESQEMAEYCATRWLFDEKILHVDGLVLHSSAVVYENRAYLFSADSGTGKSTHTRLWLKRFGEDRAFILNDDAPALRKIDGAWFAYGTPWSGTSSLNVNVRVPLQGIGFIERSQTNWTKQISPDEAMKLFMRQTTSPLQKKTLVKTLDRIVALLEEIPVFLVGCTMDPDAARVSYEAMRDARSYKALGGKLN